MIAQLAAAALLLAQAASPPPACLTRQEAGDAALALVPQLIEALSRQCGPHLPETAFLRSGAPAFADRLRSEAPEAPTRAAQAFSRVSGRPLPQGMSPAVALGAIAGAIAEGPLRNIDAAGCAEASNLVEALSPLPTSSFAQLVATGFALIGARAGAGVPRICPA